MATHKDTMSALNAVFPTDISKIISGMVVHHQTEWTINLMKPVLRDIRQLRKLKKMIGVDLPDRVKRMVIEISTGFNQEGTTKRGKDTSGGVGWKHFRNYVNCMMEIKLKIGKCTVFDHYETYYNKYKVFRYTSKYGFSSKAKRPTLKWCRLCDERKIIDEFKNSHGHICENACIECVSARRKKNSKYVKRPTGFEKLPVSLRELIVSDYKDGMSIKSISEKYKHHESTYPLVKYRSLLRLNKLGQIKL